MTTNEDYGDMNKKASRMAKEEMGYLDLLGEDITSEEGMNKDEKEDFRSKKDKHLKNLMKNKNKK